MDENIEKRLRDAYRWAMGKDLERSLAAIGGLSRDEADQALRYGLVVVGMIVHEIYPTPDGPEFDVLAEEIFSEEDWADLGGVHEISLFLRVASTGDQTFQGVDVAKIPALTVASGAHLLLHYSDEDQEWWNYLDQVWNRIEQS